MIKKNIVEIDAEEIRKVLTDYLASKVDFPVQEETFRACFKDVCDPYLGTSMRVFDRCRIEFVQEVEK